MELHLNVHALDVSDIADMSRVENEKSYLTFSL